MNDSISSTVTSARRRVQRVRHELRRRELQVLRSETITPHFRRIVLGGDALAGFVSSGFDDHIKLILQSANGETVMRDYTPRHYDAVAGELVIEFALHDSGPVSDWAAQAEPGQTIVVGGPKGSFIIPTDYEWHLLIADETGLPAVCRRLEELPAGTRVSAMVLTADPADQRVLTSAATLDQQWFTQPEQLLAAVRTLTLAAGEGFVWCAGEAKISAQLRKILVEEKGHDRTAIRAAAYWKEGAAGHHENLENPPV